MGFISLIITALGLGQGLVDRTLLEQRKKYDQRTLFLDLGAGAAYTTEYTLNTEYWFISNLIPKKKKKKIVLYLVDSALLKVDY